MIGRSLRWYWRTNLAVVAGVSVAVSVLGGSLLVGDSVRTSLRRIAVERLGATDAAILGTTFFRDALADDVTQAAEGDAIAGAIPLVAVEGLVANPGTRRRAANVQVFGVDDRFWRFHAIDGVIGPPPRGAFLSPALAEEIGAGDGDGVLIRVRDTSDIPAGVLQGRRDDLARSFRASVDRVLPAAQLGEFSLSAGQAPVRSVFVPLERLQRELRRENAANVVLITSGGGDEWRGPVDEAVARAATLEDLGLTLRIVEAQRALSLESGTGYVDRRWQKAAERAAAELGLRTRPVLTYIANTIGTGGKEIPYSVVAGMDLEGEAIGSASGLAGPGEGPAPDQGGTPIWLNEWAARELEAEAGDAVRLEYYLWSDEEGLTTDQHDFTFAGVVPMAGAGGDRTLTPEYPGMTDAPQMGDWDPPFPVDLRRIQPRDEQYWDEYRAAPKAFVRLEDAQRLWSTRFGDVTSIRLVAPDGVDLDEVRRTVTERLTGPEATLRSGLDVHPVRERALSASQGSTDFGEYFFYFSFFLFVSGLILAVLFFKLGIEQRAPEVGLLRALGFTPAQIRWRFMAEGGVLAATGALLGMPGAVAFCALILAGLRTWWIDAVGTSAIALDVGTLPLAIGAGAGLAAGFLTIAASLGALRRVSARALMAGTIAPAEVRSTPRFLGMAYPRWIALLLLASAALIVSAAAGVVSQVAAFFGAGGLLLSACILAFSLRLRRAARGVIETPGAAGLVRLGARQARWRPARSVLVVSLIASATFVIVAVGAFRRDAAIEPRSPRSGTGGFPLYAESVIPVMYDPGSASGRVELGFSTDEEALLEGTAIARFRLRPGDEGSCLNLYRPTNPRILAPSPAFVEQGRFTFSETMAATDEERANPWLLLDRTFEDGAVPVIGDATSLTYVLHRRVGDDLVLAGDDGTPIALRVVAALSHSVLQSELIVSESQFVRLFPRREGYRFFLIDAPPDRQEELAALLEDRFSDLGLDVQSSVERLRAYERVERTYLSTFQTLGGLGLVLGTLGLGAVLLRNVLERRRELALLRAVGYRPVHVRGLVLAESLLMLAAGVVVGTAAALVAVAPALWSRGGGGPGWTDTAWLLAVVAVAGVLSSLVAARAATRAAPIVALRSE